MLLKYRLKSIILRPDGGAAGVGGKAFGPGKEPRCFFAGGRVNLIGEYVDFNGGHVLPCALTMGTWALLRRRSDSRLRFFSMNFPQLGVLEGTLSNIRYQERNQWTNYVLGMLFALRERGIELSSGFELLIYGNIPNGSGLSSSASLVSPPSVGKCIPRE